MADEKRLQEARQRLQSIRGGEKPVQSERLGQAQQRLKQIRLEKQFPRVTGGEVGVPLVSLQLEEPKPSLAQELGATFKERAQRIGETFKKTATGEITPVETGIRAVGDVAGGVTEAAFEVGASATKQAVKGFLGLGKLLLPKEAEEKIAEKSKEITKNFIESDFAKQSLKDIQITAEVAENLKQRFPRATRNIEALFEISELIPAKKAATVTTKAAEEAVTAARRGAGEVAERVGERIVQQTTEETLDIIKPKPKTLSTKERLRRIEAGGGEETTITGKIRLKPTDADTRVAQSVQNIISRDKNAFDNIGSINQEITRKSKDIDSRLSRVDWNFDRKLIDDVLDPLKDESRILFGADKTLENNYDLIANKFVDIFNKKPNNLKGLLEARREFDQFVKGKFPNIFDKVGGDSVRSAAVMDTRRAINDFIAQKAPENLIGVDVKNELLDISNIFTARKNIARNVLADLDTNRLQRFVKKVSGGLTNTLLLGGGITVGAMTGLLSNPIALFAIASGASFKIGKNVVTSKRLKQATKRLLELIGEKKIDVDTTILNDTIKLLEAPKGIQVGPKADVSGIIREIRPGQQVQPLIPQRQLPAAGQTTPETIRLPREAETTIERRGAIRRR